MSAVAEIVTVVCDTKDGRATRVERRMRDVLGDEGIDWILGSHDPKSTDATALLAANALARDRLVGEGFTGATGAALPFLPGRPYTAESASTRCCACERLMPVSAGEHVTEPAHAT